MIRPKTICAAATTQTRRERDATRAGAPSPKPPKMSACCPTNPRETAISGCRNRKVSKSTQTSSDFNWIEARDRSPLRRPLEDKTQIGCSLLQGSRDARIVFVHRAIVDRKIGAAFKVQNRVVISNGRHLDAGGVLVGVVDGATQRPILRGGDMHHNSLLRF